MSMPYKHMPRRARKRWSKNHLEYMRRTWRGTLVGWPCDSARRRSLSAFCTTLRIARRKTSLLANVSEAPNRSTSTPGCLWASGLGKKQRNRERARRTTNGGGGGGSRYIRGHEEGDKTQQAGKKDKEKEKRAQRGRPKYAQPPTVYLEDRTGVGRTLG